MRLLNKTTCTAFGHEPLYYQARLTKDCEIIMGKYARSARCDSDNSVKIHTPGLLDFSAWFLLAGTALRFTLTEWHRGKRRTRRRLFRKRTSYCP